MRIEASDPSWDQPSEFKIKDLIHGWSSALAERRSVWCWNRSLDESHALWKIYGERGVAVFSTVGKLRAALENAGVESGIVAALTYIGKMEKNPRKKHNREMKAMTRGRNPYRPYLFKRYWYHLEEEVRFVIRTNPEATADRKGALIRIKAKDLITTFGFSDDIPEIERHSLKALANEKRFEDVTVAKHSNSDFQNPFSGANEPPGVFRDLD